MATRKPELVKRIKQLKQKQLRWPKIDKKPSAGEVVIAIRTLIKYIGENPDRPGLVDTPLRVIKAWKNDWGLGYDSAFIRNQTRSILGGQFDDGAENYDEMICLRRVPFYSFCEHHMALFSGYASVGYLPNKKILGLSKLARTVNMFSRKLQVQERLTTEIADFLDRNCKPLGVAVQLEATHTCICSRGIKTSGVDAVTTALRGIFLKDESAKAEFLASVRR